MDIVRVKKSKLSIELTPLVDVVFQLLIFFMLASSFSNPAIQMTLPKAKTQDKQVQETIVVGITQNQDLTINGKETTIDSFIADLKLRLIQNDSRSIHIRGDKNVPYGTFIQIVDLARQAGAGHVNLVHEEGK